MDVVRFPCPPESEGRPDRCDRVALVLQGGGALGAYQGGVYQALHEARVAPDWLCGVSIGAINAAIIAGNAPEARLAKLRGFWELIAGSRPEVLLPEGDVPRQIANGVSSLSALLFGQPGFFRPNLPGPLFSLRGAPQATAFYDTAPLRETLLRFVDFDRLNTGGTRFAVGAVNVATGNFAFFDNAETAITPDHIMASAALPPGFPMVEIAGEYFWDGALVSNTPLTHLLTNIERHNALVFQVDLFSARGPVPADIMEVGLRQKEIQYSSRTRLVTDAFKEQFALKNRLRKLLARMPEELLTEEDRAQRDALHDMSEVTILQLIYEHAPYEGDSRDYEFSHRSMTDHWNRGYQDTRLTLERKEWLELPGGEIGIVSHDVHRDSR
jgi:NTE family protein